MFLISIKPSRDAKPRAQGVHNEEDTLNFVRKVMLNIQSMEETSADLKAMQLIEEVKAGQAKGIEGAAGRVVVIQLDKGE